MTTIVSKTQSLKYSMESIILKIYIQVSLLKNKITVKLKKREENIE